MTSFQHKTVWITGASAGIGEALSEAFAREGTKLVLSARSREALETVANKCRHLGSPLVLVQPLDLTNSSGFEAVAAEVVKQTGSLDVLVNNGGRSQRSLVKDTPMHLYRDLMEVNYFGAVALTKAALPYLQQQPESQVIVISSLVGKIGSPLRSGYAAAKHALHGFFDSLRAEMMASNLKVLLVCPGFIKTNVSVNAVDASGNATGKMDDNQAKGMEPTVLAQKILNAVKQGKQEIKAGGKETLILTIKRFLPNLVNKIVSKQH